jgi:hypothetical protein
MGTVGTQQLGQPIAWTAIDEGMPVYDPHGKVVGVAEHIVGDPALDIFDGILVHTRPLPGHHRFADLDQIADLRERGIVLAVERDQLHEPPGRRRDEDRRESTAESPLEARLRRAWDWLNDHLGARDAPR